MWGQVPKYLKCSTSSRRVFIRLNMFEACLIYCIQIDECMHRIFACKRQTACMICGPHIRVNALHPVLVCAGTLFAFIASGVVRSACLMNVVLGPIGLLWLF